MKKQPKQYSDDDGRVICDMDVAGMPWHDRHARSEKRALKLCAGGQTYQMSPAESRSYTFSAVLAGLAIVAVFGVTWAALILFMTKAWFR